MPSGKRVREDASDEDCDVAPPKARRGPLLTDELFAHITASNTWHALFHLERNVSPNDDTAHANALKVRNMMLKIAHPDKASDSNELSRAHEATTIINRRWEEAKSFFDQDETSREQPAQSRNGDQDSAPRLEKGATFQLTDAPRNQATSGTGRVVPSIVPGGSLSLLEESLKGQPNGQPPTLLKNKDGNVYVGFGSLKTLEGCRFLPMSTNRCISPDVVAQRVTQNLKQLRKTNRYSDFGQISVVAVRMPLSEQFVEETLSRSGGASGEKTRFARFYVLDGQHRLMTMVELAKERPNVPIEFELSVKVVDNKQQANEALMHMQHTYRSDPKCFFLIDNEAAVAAQVLDLAKLRWPKAFVATHNQSFSSKVQRVDRPKLHDGLFFDVLRDTGLLSKQLNTYHAAFNVEYDGHAYSSVYFGQPPGVGHGRGMLDSEQAWSAQHNDRGEWMRLDLGSVQQVAGVVTQARAGHSPQSVTRYRVEVSADGVRWCAAKRQEDEGEVFDGNEAGSGADCKKEALFSLQLAARFVKIVVEEWHQHISMRAAVLIADPSKNDVRASALFSDLVLVNDTMRRKAKKMVQDGKLKLSETTVTKQCGEALQGCFLGLYHRDKSEDAKALLEMLKKAHVIPSSASVPKDEA